MAMLENRLKEVLKARDMSVYRLAKLSGVTNQTLLAIANDKRHKIDFVVLEKICDALECDPCDIVTRTIGRPKKSQPKARKGKR